MLARSILVISLLLLSACNSTIKNTHIDKNQTLDVNHGVVGVQVINNSDALAVNHKGWTEVIVVRLDNMEVRKQQAIDKAKEKKNYSIDQPRFDWKPDFYSLTPTQEGLIDSQIFIGSMPDGRYMISSLYSFYNGGDYTSWLTMPVDVMAGIFTVKKGQLTNLGSIVFQPLLNVQEKSFWSQQSSKKAYVTRLNTLRAIDSFLFTHYPNLANSLNLDNVLTWEKDTLDSFRSELSTLSRQNAYGKTAMPLSIHGKSVIASKFGQLKWQDKQDKWHQVNLATNSQLAAILETEDMIMVAGERGEIFTAKDWQQAWTPVSRVPATEAIIWFGAGKSSYYAMTQSSNEYSAYKFSSLASDWQKLTSFQRNTNNFLTVIGNVFPIITKSGQLSVLNDKKLFQHDLITDTWKEIRTDSMLAIASLPTGDLAGVEVSQWDGIGDQVISQNSGESWISINRYLKSFADGEAEKSVPLMLADGTVLTLGREGLKSTNGKRASSELKIISTHISTANDKKSWQYHGFAKSDCETLLAQISSKEELYFLCDKGDIVFTKDFGMTWQYVIDIEIADMQFKYNQLIEAIKVENSKEAKLSSTRLNEY
ncbi:hypothetical protein [Shewanella sp. OMA3-2]|uniref:hypothetical protein n=1 Tax=Shewanella sp. OMA3-2 TaxID=2908650 RepID=UPI001F16CCD5|nr:hypothetical protein [Shewanella sp. OMA3-2]UJF22581.1 hypothetical protein L0B17_04005 [Shewanella sp. OMA3-2]